MNFLLFRATNIISNLTETELLRRLSDIVGPERKIFNFNYSNPDKQYVGKIEGHKFKIYRIVKGRNSFIPIIQGNIVDNLKERNIEIKMRLHWVVILFLLWISGLIVYYLLKLNDKNGLIFLGLIYGMTIFFFNQECNKSIRDLKQILGGQIE